MPLRKLRVYDAYNKIKPYTEYSLCQKHEDCHEYGFPLAHGGGCYYERLMVKRHRSKRPKRRGGEEILGEDVEGEEVEGGGLTEAKGDEGLEDVDLMADKEKLRVLLVKVCKMQQDFKYTSASNRCLCDEDCPPRFYCHDINFKCTFIGDYGDRCGASVVQEGGMHLVESTATKKQVPRVAESVDIKDTESIKEKKDTESIKEKKEAESSKEKREADKVDPNSIENENGNSSSSKSDTDASIKEADLNKDADPKKDPDIDLKRTVDGDSKKKGDRQQRTAEDPCLKGLACHPEIHRCLPLAHSIQRDSGTGRIVCRKYADCPATHYCSLELEEHVHPLDFGICVPKLNEGQSCTDHRQCKFGLGCVEDLSGYKITRCHRRCYTNLDCYPKGVCISGNSTSSSNHLPNMRFCFGDRPVLYPDAAAMSFHEQPALDSIILLALAILGVLIFFLTTFLAIFYYKRAKARG